MIPTLSQVQAWDTTHLDEAAQHWETTADLWEHTFTRIHQESQAPGGTVWQGAAAEAAQY